MKSKVMNLKDYVACGYYLSRWADSPDCTGTKLRRVTMAHDHSQRRFFPHTWALSWCSDSREDRLERAASFGILEGQLDDVISWADEGFDKKFAAWSAFFTLEAARTAARSMLQSAEGLELWGVGLHRSLLVPYCEESKPPPPKPGYAPIGASGTHLCACVHAKALAVGGEVLGHEILIDDDGCCFNSLESLHLDEQEPLRAVGVTPNSNGLIDSFDEALACCQRLDSRKAGLQHGIKGWRPWLLVSYPLF